MKSEIDNNSCKSEQLNAGFSKALLISLSVILLIGLIIMSLLAYGVHLFLSEPEPLVTANNQKAKIGFDINKGQFEFTFNEASLNDFSFDAFTSQNPCLTPSQHDSSLRQQIGLSQTNYRGLYDIKPVRTSSKHDNALKDLKIFIRDNRIIMVYPMQFGASKKTITIEETLKIEDDQLVSDIESLKFGRLNVPSFMIPFVLDIAAPQIINRVYGNLQRSDYSYEHTNQITSVLEDVEISKTLMPPTILVLFGPREPLVNLLQNDEEKSHILRSLPTLKVTDVTINDNKLKIEGVPDNLSLLNLIELLRPLFE